MIVIYITGILHDIYLLQKLRSALFAYMIYAGLPDRMKSALLQSLVFSCVPPVSFLHTSLLF